MTSVGGFICCIGGGPTAWESKKQVDQALSSVESDVHRVAGVCSKPPSTQEEFILQIQEQELKISSPRDADKY
ncbi:hypothetical protein CLOP_g17196 [Closterium sp. NIES-67]|nr:hypothetical protein CLOP_g17196 [Closterium sp. NIES-67]